MIPITLTYLKIALPRFSALYFFHLFFSLFNSRYERLRQYHACGRKFLSAFTRLENFCFRFNMIKSQKLIFIIKISSLLICFIASSHFDIQLKLFLRNHKLYTVSNFTRNYDVVKVVDATETNSLRLNPSVGTVVNLSDDADFC